MRVTVTGATGLIGRAFCEALRSRGDEVVAVSRDAERARARMPWLSDSIAWDLTFAPMPVSAITGSDAVVHLAGETVSGRWDHSKKLAILATRRDGTRRVVEAIATADPKPSALVSASAVGYYGSRGDEILTEQSPPGDTFLSNVAAVWEAEAAKAASLGLRVVFARTAIVLSPEGGALAEMARPFEAGIGGPYGSGRQWMPWIHIEDEVRLLMHVLDHGEDITGAINASSPNPVRNVDFAHALGEMLGKPSFLPAPGFALRALLSDFAQELLDSRRVAPTVAIKSGFEFRFPVLAEALKDIYGAPR